jgi:hypothetical protein
MRLPTSAKMSQDELLGRNGPKHHIFQPKYRGCRHGPPRTHAILQMLAAHRRTARGPALFRGAKDILHCPSGTVMHQGLTIELVGAIEANHGERQKRPHSKRAGRCV